MPKVEEYAVQCGRSRAKLSMPPKMTRILRNSARNSKPSTPDAVKGLLEQMAAVRAVLL
jgi:hypothetical protein